MKLSLKIWENSATNEATHTSDNNQSPPELLGS